MARKKVEKTNVVVMNSSLLVYNINIPLANDMKAVEGMLPSVDQKLIKQGAAVMVWASNNAIKELHHVEHTRAEIKRYNELGIYIYLFEPLCSYYHGDESAMFNNFNCGFYSEFPNQLPSDRKSIRAAELDSIKLYAMNNGLTNITVFTGDYNTHRYYSFYRDSMKLKCDDLFLKGITGYDILDTTPKENITKKFISTSWRFAPHRAIVSALLARKDAELAWHFTVPFDVAVDTPWMEMDVIREEFPEFFKELLFGLDVLNARAPLCMDLISEEATPVTECAGHFYPLTVPGYVNYKNPVSENPHTLPLQQYYRECFVDVVTESRYAQPTSNLSEKILQSIQFQTPFILVAPPYSLKYLKTLGYKTFDQWWDESYDEQESHMDRMVAISRLINEIQGWTKTKLDRVYAEMREILEYNFNHFVTAVPGATLRPIAGLVQHEVKDIKWSHTEDIKHRDDMGPEDESTTEPDLEEQPETQLSLQQIVEATQKKWNKKKKSS
jgi:hypothetical protein